MKVNQSIKFSLVKALVRCFEIELSIKMFGRSLLHFKFPPSDDSCVESIDVSDFIVNLDKSSDYEK